jgi:DDE superfamily endonuclease
VAAVHGLRAEEAGPIEAERFVSFVWQVAGRPALHSMDWKRARPLVVVLDNYSVHKSQVVQEAMPGLEAANIMFFYLPSYSPELSHIESIWHSIKQHGMPQRSYSLLGDLKRAVDDALSRKACELQETPAETTNFHRLAA